MQNTQMECVHHAEFLNVKPAGTQSNCEALKVKHGIADMAVWGE